MSSASLQSCAGSQSKSPASSAVPRSPSTGGGGFNCWPDGPQGEPLQIHAPTWGQAVVVENEIMFHHGHACGPVAMRAHTGLDVGTTIGVDPETEGGWRITTRDVVNQRIPAEELRFLVHWGACLFVDYEELEVTFDHTDHITAERAIETLIDDMRERGVAFELPSDSMNDRSFVRLVSQVYDTGSPGNIPPPVRWTRSPPQRRPEPNFRPGQFPGRCARPCR